MSEELLYKAAALFRERDALAVKLRALDAQIEATRISYVQATTTFGLTALMLRKECEKHGVLNSRAA